jgi:hypothetical protein
MLLFIETSYFTSIVEDYFTDTDYEQFQLMLGAYPLKGVLIPGTGGCRKIRYKAHGKGQRGGLRIIYYFRSRKGIIYLLDMYSKNEKSDLTHAERKIIRTLIKEIENDAS